MRWLIALAVTALAATAPAAAPTVVLLIPFDAAADREKNWVAKAIHQNFIAELARNASLSTVLADTPVSDPGSAIKAATAAGATYVIFGAYQSVDGNLRITGQLVDAKSQQAVAVLKATGSLRDLFGLEDMLVAQARAALPPPPAAAPLEMLQQPLAAAAPPQPPIRQVSFDDAGRRAQDLQEQIDRALDRMRYAPAYDDSYYYAPAYGYPFSYYPSYRVTYFPRHHHHRGADLRIHGSYNGRHWNVQFGAGSHAHVGQSLVVTTR